MVGTDDHRKDRAAQLLIAVSAAITLIDIFRSLPCVYDAAATGIIIRMCKAPQKIVLKFRRCLSHIVKPAKQSAAHRKARRRSCFGTVLCRFLRMLPQALRMYLVPKMCLKQHFPPSFCVSGINARGELRIGKPRCRSRLRLLCKISEKTGRFRLLHEWDSFASGTVTSL